MILLLMILQLQSNLAPAELAEIAEQYFLDEQYSSAIGAWSELFSRMPERGRILYNLASSQFLADSLSAADSVLSTDITDVGEDTLMLARKITSLALAIQENDYAGVESSVNALRNAVADGLSLQCEKTGLEAGLNWLDNHEPPEDQQDQNEDKQDQNEDQQNQNEDQQDQNEDQQDQNEDQQNEQQPPPQINEMTPEQAQAILDLLEDTSHAEDSTGTKKIVYPAGPIW
jgi:flagellar biosynthesis GTPase FlhF